RGDVEDVVVDLGAVGEAAGHRAGAVDQDDFERPGAPPEQVGSDHGAAEPGPDDDDAWEFGHDEPSILVEGPSRTRDGPRPRPGCVRADVHLASRSRPGVIRPERRPPMFTPARCPRVTAPLVAAALSLVFFAATDAAAQVGTITGTITNASTGNPV